MTEFNKLDDRAIVSITGKDKYNFLQGLISNDINIVNETHSIYSLMLTPQGKYFLDLFIIFSDNKIIVEVPVTKISDVIRKLNIYKLRADVNVVDISKDFSVYSLTNADCNEFNLLDHEGSSANYLNGKIFVDPRLKKLGLRIVIPNDQIKAIEDNYTKSKIDYDCMRIELAVPEGDKDLITEKSFPLEFKLDQFNAFNFSKGCYVGQELISRTKYRGVIRKKIYKIASHQKMPENGTELEISGSKIGIVCSSYDNIALALIREEDYHKALSKGKIYAKDKEIWVVA